MEGRVTPVDASSKRAKAAPLWIRSRAGGSSGEAAVSHRAFGHALRRRPAASSSGGEAPGGASWRRRLQVIYRNKGGCGGVGGRTDVWRRNVTFVNGSSGPICMGNNGRREGIRPPLSLMGRTLGLSSRGLCGSNGLAARCILHLFFPRDLILRFAVA